MAQYFFNPRSTYVTNTGQVASLGRLAFYESGTQTPQSSLCTRWCDPYC